MKIVFLEEFGVTVFDNGDIVNGRGRTLKVCKCRAGYSRVYITKPNGKRFGAGLHRLIAMAFISNPLNLPEVNHLDANKSNNSIENLEWCTRQQNMKHAKDNKLMTGPKSRITSTAKRYRVIRELYQTGKYTYDDLAEVFSVSNTIIGQAVKQINEAA